MKCKCVLLLAQYFVEFSCEDGYSLLILFCIDLWRWL